MSCYDLPWPPTVNMYWRHDRGRTHISDEGKRYRRAVAVAVQPLRDSTLRGRLHVRIWAFAPDNRKRDLDNLCKGPLDAMAAAFIYGDDSQIDHLEVLRRPVEAPHGRLLVEVEETAPATAAEEKALKRKAAPSVRYPCRA